MTPIAPFNPQHLEAACRVLADTERGLTGTQIERLLQEIKQEAGQIIDSVTAQDIGALPVDFHPELSH